MRHPAISPSCLRRYVGLSPTRARAHCEALPRQITYRFSLMEDDQTTCISPAKQVSYSHLSRAFQERHGIITCDSKGRDQVIPQPSQTSWWPRATFICLSCTPKHGELEQAGQVQGHLGSTCGRSLGSIAHNGDPRSSKLVNFHVSSSTQGNPKMKRTQASAVLG